MDLPDAATALEEATRPRRPRSQPKAYHRAMSSVMTTVSRAVAAGMTSTVVNMPTFLFGEPRFCVDDVTQHVRMNLESRGYAVTTFPGSPSIAIQWGRVAQGRAKSDTDVDQTHDEAPGRFDIGL